MEGLPAIIRRILRIEGLPRTPPIDFLGVWQWLYLRWRVIKKDFLYRLVIFNKAINQQSRPKTIILGIISPNSK